MDVFVPKHRITGNTMVQSLYSGVANGGGGVTTLLKPHADMNRMERVPLEGPTPSLGRGQSGNAAVIIVGGMETTLDEVRDILAARREKKFVQHRGYGEIVQMCRELQERRNSVIRYFRRNPSEAPRPKKKVRLLLPVGCRWVQSNEPGLQLRVRT